MKMNKIDHLGIAVTDLDVAIATYSALYGVKPTEIEEVADQKVRVAIFEIGESRVELLEPTADDSPIAVFLQKRGPGLNHVAYGVEDLMAELERLRAMGVCLIDERPRAGAGGALIAFIHPKSTGGVLTELCQRK